MYTTDVLREISDAHRNIGLVLYRHGIKNLVFLGGGDPGEPCLAEITGVDRRHRPPVVEFEGVFPSFRTAMAWTNLEGDRAVRRRLRFSIDADGRPTDGTTVLVETDHAAFTGTVHHIGEQWTVRWQYRFHDAPKPLPDQTSAAASAQTA